MVVYFSGTGNSRYAAQLLADRLGDTLLDAGAEIKAQRSGAAQSDKPWVFVCPTYAWQIPRFFESYIRNGLFEGNRNVYFVMTCGQDIGQPEKLLTELCRIKGLRFQGVWEVVMPENYVAMFSVPGREEAAALVQAARPVIEEAVEWIRREEPFPGRKSSLIGKLKSGPIDQAFYAFCVKAKAFQTTVACDGCGLCEKLCPLNNISLSDKQPLWGRNCTHCMACICGCPKEAIEYGRKSKGKPRYQCPKYEG